MLPSQGVRASSLPALPCLDRNWWGLCQFQGRHGGGKRLVSPWTSPTHSNLQASPGRSWGWMVATPLGKLSGEEGVLCKALGVHCSQARAPRYGATETLPPPQMQNWGYGAQFGSRETWQHGERRQKGGAAGRAPRSPEKWGRGLKALTQGTRGLQSSVQPGRAAGKDTCFPRATDGRSSWVFLTKTSRAGARSLRGRKCGLQSGAGPGPVAPH